MLKKFSIAAFCIISFVAQAADNRVPDSLEQINADLLAKKAKAEPFNDKDIKVDLESLGLDEIDSKDNAKNNNPTPTNTKAAEVPVAKSKTNTTAAVETPSSKPTTATTTQTKEIKSPATTNTSSPATATAPKETQTKTKLLTQPTKTDNKTTDDKLAATQDSATNSAKDNDKKNANITTTPTNQSSTVINQDNTKTKLLPISGTEIKNIGNTAISKIQGLVEKVKNVTTETNKTEVTTTNTTEQKNPNHVNDLKSQNLKKQLAAKRAAKKQAELNEKKRAEKLAKLNKLRQKYLIKIDSPKTDSDEDTRESEDLEEEEVKIVPHKKEINKFVSYETPAPPILNRYRSHDNVGIPVFLTKKEKIDNLFRSVLQEDISYFNSALEDISDPNVKNMAGDTILTYAILLQKHDVIASILGKGADPNMINNLGYTPLQLAIEMSDVSSFNLLVNANADVNYVDGFGRTYLMHSARVGLLSATETLIKKGVDVNMMDADGFTALAIANRHKQELTVALLLKHGAKTWVEKPYEPKEESLIKELDNRWQN